MKQVQRYIAPFKRRIMLMVGRAVLRLVNDDSKLQTVQISLLDGEVRDGVERIQEYGFTSHPLPGAECAAVFLGGNRDHGLVIAIDDRRYRLTGLAAGEVALYDDLGKSLVLKRNGDIEITATRVVVNGDLEVNGDVHATGTVLDDAGNTNHHTHP